MHKKQIYNELYNFVANNKTIFEPYLSPQSQKANIVKDIEIYEPTRLRKKYKKYKLLCQNNQKFCKNILFIKELKSI